MLQPCKKTAVRLPGPSTSEKGMILLTGATHPVGCVAPKVVSVAVKVTIDVIVCLPNYVTIAVVRFHRAPHIVANNRVAFTVLYFRHRNV